MTSNLDDGVLGESRYPSKRDLWIIGVILATVTVLVVAALDLISAPIIPFMKYALVSMCLASAVLSIWILLGTSYTLASDRLIARCGPFTTTVSLEAIEGVSPSRSPLASPACSLDRLHIRHRGSSSGLLVSPIDKRAFLESLVARCPNLATEGDTVVQKAT